MKRSFPEIHFSAGIAVIGILLFTTALPLLADDNQTPTPQEETSVEEMVWDEGLDPTEGDGPRMEGFLKRLEEIDPERAEHLRQLRKENPQKFFEEIRRDFQNRVPGGPRMGQSHPPVPDSPDGDRPGPGPRQGRPDMRDDRGMRGRWQEHMQKRHEEFIQWLEKNYPDQAASLAKLKEEDPSAYVAKSGELRKKYEPIIRIQDENPRLAELLKEDLDLQQRRDELLREIRFSNETDKQILNEELQMIVARRFDLILEKKQIQYEELEKRLLRLQQELEKRQEELTKLKDNKEKAVEERIQDLTSQNEKVGWDG